MPDTVPCVVCGKKIENSFPHIWFAAGLATCGPEHQRQKLAEIAAAINNTFITQGFKYAQKEETNTTK